MDPKRAEKRYNRQMIGAFLRGSRLLFLLSMLASALAALADMVVLSENPCKMDPRRLRELRVEQLLLGGQPYRSCRAGVAGSMLRGLFSRAKA